MPSASIEDYLRVMHEHRERSGGPIRVNEMAKALSVSKASVSQMMGRLEREGLVTRSPYSAVDLSRKGLAESARITRRHRIIEVFLSGSLGMEGPELEAEVHSLEHAFSDDALERLDRMLGRPERCPHGNRIDRG